MDWSDWVTYEPKNRDEIVSKIENDGYTYPHYDKSKNGVKFVMCLETIEKDCQATGTTLNKENLPNYKRFLNILS